MLLAHPEAENLGRFVEGTLDEPERAAIVQHIADCDDCRMLVVDAAEFIEPAKTESHKWWMGIAAAAVLVAVIGTLTYHQRRDPEVPLIETSSHLRARLTEERLAGFSYGALNRMRGSRENDDPAGWRLDEEIGKVLERRGDNAKTLHARGIAHLLAASRATETDEIKAERTDSVAALKAAVDRAPDNAAYQTDLAAALLVTGNQTNRDLALSHLKKALAIDRRNPEALFNQAIALRDSDPKAAIAAFKSYLAVDSSSQWAKEARQNLENLQDGL